MKCICNDQRHSLGTAIWHQAYCRWYDNRTRGRRARTALWGFLADRVVRFA